MASNLRVDSIVPSTSGNVSIGTATGGVTIPGDLGISGTLTYEDVANIDSVGVITARSGIRIGATGANTLITGNGTGIGIGITAPTGLLEVQKNGVPAIIANYNNSKHIQMGAGSNGAGFHLTTGNFFTINHQPFADRGTDNNLSERIRIGPVGQIGIGGANYGTAGQVLTSQGSGSAVQWASASNPTLAHAFVFMDSQYFTSSVTLLEFNNSTTGDRSSGVTITRGGSERFTPTVAGVYFVQAHLTYSHGGGSYTPVLYIYKNGSGYNSVSSNGIVSYSGGHNDSLSCQVMVTMNGTSDYVDMRASHNGGGNATMKSYSTFAMFRVGA